MEKSEKSTAEKLNKEWLDLMDGFKMPLAFDESALDSQGNFKKFSLYKDIDICYAENAATL